MQGDADWHAGLAATLVMPQEDPHVTGKLADALHQVSHTWVAQCPSFQCNTGPCDRGASMQVRRLHDPPMSDLLPCIGAAFCNILSASASMKLGMGSMVSGAQHWDICSMLDENSQPCIQRVMASHIFLLCPPTPPPPLSKCVVPKYTCTWDACVCVVLMYCVRGVAAAASRRLLAGSRYAGGEGPPSRPHAPSAPPCGSFCCLTNVDDRLLRLIASFALLSS
jgi:hypothetical protein